MEAESLAPVYCSMVNWFPAPNQQSADGVIPPIVYTGTVMTNAHPEMFYSLILWFQESVL